MASDPAIKFYPKNIWLFFGLCVKLGYTTTEEMKMRQNLLRMIIGVTLARLQDAPQGILGTTQGPITSRINHGVKRNCRVELKRAAKHAA